MMVPPPPGKAEAAPAVARDVEAIPPLARNAMTVDVEDWFQVQNFAGRIARTAWDHCAWRVEVNTHRILDRFAEAGVRATFFTLGWVAERYPGLIRRMVAEGHEVASHGYHHELVRAIGADRFRADIRAAKAMLEDTAGVAVTGYRAPTFSLTPATTPWAYAILAEAGYRYSSSVFPGRHGEGAAPPLTPFHPAEASGVVELPMTVLPGPMGRLLPLSGGGWFRLTPYAVFRAGLRRVNAAGRRGVFYFHPWEVDPDQPRVEGVPALARFKHYHGLAEVEARLRLLLRDFAWEPMDSVFAAEIGAAGTGTETPEPLAAAA